MTLHVHLGYMPTDEERAILRRELDPEVQLTMGEGTPDTAEYQILVAGRPSRQQMTASPHLHTLIIPWAGLPASTRDLLADFPHVAVHNLHHNAAPVAELTLALLLAAARAIVPFDQALRAGDWRPRYRRPGPSVLLAEKTALILGYGAIGQRAANLCKALGMGVLATRRRLQEPVRKNDVLIHPAEALPHLLPQANALIICLPLTPETEGLIGKAELALLPSPALLVNVGRGAIVKQKALYQALQEGELHAAGLDVWYNYPSFEETRSHTPPADYPFHELDNVVMSPHRGGGSDATADLRMSHLAASLNAAARKAPIPNPVDREAGY